MDNNEVYALFEDIKGNLKSINNKLENTPKVSNNQSGGQALAMDLTPVKELFNNSAREHQEQTRAMLTKFAEAEVKASNRILKLLWALKESLPKVWTSRRNISTATASTSGQVRSFSLLVGMGVVCGLSIWGNIELWQSKRQYEDDALKFRAIRSWGGCSPKEILWLNDVFDIHRNETAIEWVRGQADGYDRDLKTVSDSLMQESLKVRQVNGNNKK